MEFSNTGRRAAFAARLGAITAFCAAAMSAQSPLMNPLTTAGVAQNGFHVYNVSAFSSYSTVDSSWKQVVQTTTGSTLNNLPAYSTLSGVSASFGYRISGEDSRTQFSIVYSPSFNYSVYGQAWHNVTHTVAMSWDRKIAPRWHAFSSVSGVIGNFDQILFSPNSEQNLASLSGTANQLAATMLGGPDTNPAATAATAVVSPQQRLFYGDQMLSVAASLGVSYSFSPRLSIGVAASGSRMQHIGGGGGIPANQSYYLVPATTETSGAVTLSYSLSPRTTVTGSAAYGRAFTGFVPTQYTSAQLGMSRRITRNWFVQLSGGGGYILPVGHISTNVRGKQYEASGGLGFRARNHTFVASVDRAVTDYYGMGPAAVVSTGGGWGWHRRGSSWSLQAGVSQDHQLGNVSVITAANNGFRANAGISWIPRGHAAVSLQYAYVSFSGLFYLLPTAAQQLRFAQHSVQLSFSWGNGTPGGLQTGLAAQ